MGLFGGGYSAGKPTPDPLAPVTVTPQQVLPSRTGGSGLFGGHWDANRIAQLGYGIADAVDPLTMRPTGGGSLAAYRVQRKAEAQRQAARTAFSAAFDPATGKFDAGKYTAIVMGAGGDVPGEILGGLIQKPRAPQVIQGPHGEVGLVDPDAQTPAYQSLRPADVKAVDTEERDARLAEIQARIDYYKSGVGLRSQQGAYYGAKAAQPYAPRVGRAGGGGGGSRAGGMSTEQLLAIVKGGK